MENKSQINEEFSNINLNQNSDRKFLSLNLSNNNNNNLNNNKKEKEEKNFSLNSTNFNKEQIISFAKFVAKKFTETKNSLNFSYSQYMKYSLCPNKYKEKNYLKYKILDDFSEKFEEKFNVFNYLIKEKEFKLLKKILLSSNQKDLMSIIARKYYKIEISEEKFEDEKIENEDKEIKENLLENILENLLMRNEENILERKDFDIKDEKLIKMLLVD